MQPSPVAVARMGAPIATLRTPPAASQKASLVGKASPSPAAAMSPNKPNTADEDDMAEPTAAPPGDGDVPMEAAVQPAAMEVERLDALEAGQPEELLAQQPKPLESKLPKTLEALQSDALEVDQRDPLAAEQPKELEAAQPDELEAEQPDELEAEQPETSEVMQPEELEAEQPETSAVMQPEAVEAAQLVSPSAESQPEAASAADATDVEAAPLVTDETTALQLDESSPNTAVAQYVGETATRTATPEATELSPATPLGTPRPSRPTSVAHGTGATPRLSVTTPQCSTDLLVTSQAAQTLAAQQAGWSALDMDLVPAPALSEQPAVLEMQPAGPETIARCEVNLDPASIVESAVVIEELAPTMDSAVAAEVAEPAVQSAVAADDPAHLVDSAMAAEDPALLVDSAKVAEGLHHLPTTLDAAPDAPLAAEVDTTAIEPSFETPVMETSAVGAIMDIQPVGRPMPAMATEPAMVDSIDSITATATASTVAVVEATPSAEPTLDTLETTPARAPTVPVHPPAFDILVSSTPSRSQASATATPQRVTTAAAAGSPPLRAAVTAGAVPPAADPGPPKRRIAVAIATVARPAARPVVAAAITRAPSSSSLVALTTHAAATGPRRAVLQPRALNTAVSGAAAPEPAKTVTTAAGAATARSRATVAAPVLKRAVHIHVTKPGLEFGLLPG